MRILITILRMGACGSRVLNGSGALWRLIAIQRWLSLASAAMIIEKMLIRAQRLSSLRARFFNQGRGGFFALMVLMAAGPAHGETAPRIYRDRIEPHWFATEGGPTNLFWYRLDLPAGRHKFKLVNATTGTRVEAFDHARAARELSKIISRKLDGDHLPVQWLQFVPDGKSVQLLGLKGSWRLDLQSYGLSPEPAIEPREAILTATLAPHPTRFTGDETRITFVNHLRRPLKVFWIGPDHERKSYGILGPGDNRVQQTYAGHVWLLTDFAGNIAAVFQAEAGPHLAVVDSTGARAQGAPAGGNKSPPTTSPNGRCAIVLRGDNLFLTDLKTGAG
ncbi:MAG: hypothetical protein ACRED1_07380, partial [Limisphaerales bacterium]